MRFEHKDSHRTRTLDVSMQEAVEDFFWDKTERAGSAMPVLIMKLHGRGVLTDNDVADLISGEYHPVRD